MLTPILPGLLGLPWAYLVFMRSVLLFWLGLMSIPLLAGAFVSWRWPGRWRWLLAVSLLPVLLTLEFSCWWSYQKSFWPWKGHQKELIALSDNAAAAARRLGLPTSGGMFDEEAMARLEKEVPVKMSFSVPLVDRKITARVRDGVGGIWIYWGDGRFGPLNPQTMEVAWVDD